MPMCGWLGPKQTFETEIFGRPIIDTYGCVSCNRVPRGAVISAYTCERIGPFSSHYDPEERGIWKLGAQRSPSFLLEMKLLVVGWRCQRLTSR